MNLLQSTLTSLSLICLTPFATAGNSITFYVDDSSPTTTGDGSSWPQAYVHLQDAIQAGRDWLQTQPGPVHIYVAAGVYHPDRDAAHPAGTGDPYASFRMYEKIKLYGGFVGNETSFLDRPLFDEAYASVLSGEIGAPGVQDNTYQVVKTRLFSTPPENRDLWPTLDGFTVTAGNADGGGFEQQGGGVYSDQGHGIVANCIIRGNQAALQGGGLALVASSETNFEVYNTIIEDNAAQEGGGIFCLSSSLKMEQCVIRDNVARVAGATWAVGGGMISLNSDLLFKNCTIAGNRANRAGGFWVSGSNAFDLVNSIVHGNVALSEDSHTGVNMNSSEIRIRNCAIENGLTNLLHNSSVDIVTHGVLIEDDPQFQDPANGDHRLHISSPCGDQSDSSYILVDRGDLDQDGDRLEPVTLDLSLSPRQTGSALDLGPYEAESYVPRFCDSLPNSESTRGARIRAQGSCSLAARDLTFFAGPVPNSPGLFILGMTQVQTPFGDGYLCAGGQKNRLAPMRATLNTLRYEVDWDSPTIQAEFQVGNVRQVQAWFRDAAMGGTGFNTSDGLTIEIQP